MWLKMGCAELLDMFEHHASHRKDWFSESSGPQRTWQKLIWLLLGYEGQEPNAGDTLRYQRELLGRGGGETALVELSSLPAVHNDVPVQREMFRKERISTIRERLLAWKPRFVVFYSPDKRYTEAWNEIAGVRLDRDTPTRHEGTVFVVTYHPNGQWKKAYWTEMGRRLRSLTGQLPDRQSAVDRR
ncbi:MAG TPA: hypothetical protein VGF18_00765 [Candidatus Tumulicola sp.]|jgi:hypothetical protein